jgi:2-polyprenyl-3-methyl-5-hydroxy-6-metoxy-1,4-benzoquinol methylase
MTDPNEIRSQPVERCRSCQSTGTLLYDKLVDNLYGAPGAWRIVRCANKACGQLWLDPAPVAEDLGKAYRVYPTHQSATAPSGGLARFLASAAEAYRKERFGLSSHSTSAKARWLGKLAAFIPPLRLGMDYPFALLPQNAKSRVLEIGCGNGNTLKYFAEMGWSAVGLDTDANAVKAARSFGLDIFHGDVFSANYESESFDFIYSNHVIEHVTDPEKLLAEIRRLLKPNGLCLLATPNANSIGHKLFGRHWRGLEPPRHMQIFTISSLQSLASKAGLMTQTIATSPRLALSMFIQSVLARKDGAVSPHAPLWLKLSSVGAFLLAYLYWLIGKHSGEEILFTGKKQP